VLEEVRVLLQPNAGGVVAELDKLNVYGAGGFFKPHFDTPRSEGKPLWAHAYAHAYAMVTIARCVDTELLILSC
jgi:hypothetical protein